MNIEGFCFDIEANGFYFDSDKVWCIVLKDLNDSSKVLKLFPFQDINCKEKFIDWLDDYDNPLIIGHYILGYDMLMLINHLSINFSVGPDKIENRKVRFIDTFYLSQYVKPDEDGHSIEAHGERLGLQKIDWRGKAIELGLIDANSPKGQEFQQWHEEMGLYCERDVDVNIKLFWKLLKDFQNQYSFEEELPDHFKCGQKSFFLMSAQSVTGWKFNVGLGNQLVEKINKMMREIEIVVEPQLPPRKLKKSEENDFTMPMKPFKKDGSLSSHMLKFIEKHSGELLENNTVKFFDKTYKIESNKMLTVEKPMTLSNQDDLKGWLLEKGWKPVFWNYKRGPDNKPLRDPNTRQLIQTSPKIQEAQVIDPGLLEMDGDLIKDIVKWLSLRNRLSVLTTWLENPRLKIDGRIGADRTGITPTHRQKHSVIVNVPKASDKVLLGHEFRSLFIVPSGRKIAAGDAAALEGRVWGHYTYKYDNGDTADELLNGDIHSKNAKVFYPDETENFDILSEEFNKDEKGFKPYRDRSKNGLYATLYGASPPKLAKVLGKPEKEGNKLAEAFWNANLATKLLKDNIEKYWESTGEKTWLPSIDGRRIFTRKKSALLNSIFQGCGGIVMDYACCFMDKWLGGLVWSEFDGVIRPHYIYKGYYVARIGYFHDEVEFEVDVEIAEEVSKMIEKSIVKAGEYLKLKIPLAGEGKVGDNWQMVH